MNYPNNLFQAEPARPKDLVWRKRLEPLGQSILEYPVTVVVAPAGYGKTVWVSSLLDSPGWPPAIWISLDRQDASPAVFLYHMVRSASGADRDSDAWRTLMSLENVESEWPIAASAFIGGLPRDRQLLLIFDDVDYLHGNRVAVDIMEFILARLPRNIHIVFIARSAPPIKLYRQEINNQLLDIGSRELLFSEEEARELFSNMKLELSENDFSAIFSRTEGWAAGLRLLGAYIKQPGSSLKDALQNLRRENSGFYRYIMDEFLGTMPAELKEFLLDASFLPYLEAGLCDAALGRTGSENMLAALRGYGLLSPYQEEKGFWRMHHLVEDWLRDIAAKTRMPGDVNAIRAGAAGFFERNGDVGRAVEQCFLAEDWPRAAALIHQHGYDYASSVFRMDILYKWIERLPGELVENDCRLLYFKGTSMLNVDDRLAYKTLSASADLANQNHDPKCEAGAIYSMLLTGTFCGDLAISESAGRRLTSNPELMSNPVSHKEALVAALQYAMTRDSLTEGMELSRQALKLELTPEMGMWARYVIGYLYMRVGRLREARQLTEETLKMPYVAENERRLIVGYEILMDILFITGDFQALDGVCRTCLTLCKKYGMLGIMGRVYYLTAQCRYREGNLSEARRFYDLAHEDFTSAGVLHFANQAVIDTLLLRIVGGESAEALLRQIIDLKTSFDNVPYGMGIDYMVNTSAGIAAMEAGNLVLARQFLEKSSRRWREIGSGISVTETNLLIAHVRLLQGDEDGCDNLLREALGEAEAWQWENFWGWHPATMQAMCQRALDRDIHPGWSAHILRRWFPEQMRRDLSLLLASQKRQLRELAEEHFRQEHEETGKTVLSVFFFSGFRLFANGIEIGESDWKTKKAEDLFKHLVSDRRAADKEYLMQQLWPEGDSRANDGKMRMTLSYVRKALAAAGLPGGCIIARRGGISLDPGFEIHCDYKIFMQKARGALRYARARHPYAVQALEQAVRIYSGEFLPEDRYSDFASSLRSSLHGLYLEVLAQLAQLQFERGDMPAALKTCYQYLARDPVEETIVRMAMDILCLMKKRHKAMELFRGLSVALAKEYGAEPEDETVALYTRIQTQSGQ